MRFGLRAREGWKSKKGEAYYTNRSIKITVVPTDSGSTNNQKLYYEILKLLTKYYDLEYLDKATSHTGRAGTQGGKMRRIVFEETDELIEMLMDDPSLKELKKRIMEDSDKKRKCTAKSREKLRVYRTYRKGNKCMDCNNDISKGAFRCHKCAGKQIAKKLKGRKYKKKGRKKKGLFGWKR